MTEPDPCRVRDVLTLAAPTGHQSRGLPGCKPRGFGAWIFSLVGALPGDEFRDLFPGSGGVREEWLAWDKQPPLFAAALGGTIGNSVDYLRARRREHPLLFGENA